MTNKKRIEQLEETVKSLLELRKLQHTRDSYVLEALQNLDARNKLNDKRIKWLEKDVLNMQKQDDNINDNWRPL